MLQESDVSVRGWEGGEIKSDIFSQVACRLLLPSDWSMETRSMRGEWRSSFRDSGEQCVMMAGLLWMHKYVCIVHV